MITTSHCAVVTGATQGLGLALVAELARRWDPTDTVYLTGRDAGRVAAAVSSLPAGGARVLGDVLDVSDSSSVERFASRLDGVDLVFSNAVMRIGRDDDASDVVTEFVNVNNFGTTRMLRAFGPLLRPGGKFVVVASSFGSLRYLAPVLHGRFSDLASLDEVDKQVAAWRDIVVDGSVMGSAWPGFINIPSKIGQVAAVRTYAAGHPDQTVFAVCPGMMNTPTSAEWWDVSTAPTPAQAAVPLVDLALGPAEFHGVLVRDGVVLPWV